MRVIETELQADLQAAVDAALVDLGDAVDPLVENAYRGLKEPFYFFPI